MLISAVAGIVVGMGVGAAMALWRRYGRRDDRRG
jgi:enoyl-CoA hydratase/carnithine racemase